MENYNDLEKQSKGFSKAMVAAVIAAVVLVGGGLALLALMPSESEQKIQVLEGAVREGDEGFDALTRKIVTETVEATQATTPLGMVVMTVNGRIMNNSDSTITALEAKLSILDSKGNTVKDKVFMVVPSKGIDRIGPKQEVKLAVSIDGFKENDDRADIRWKVTAIKAE